MDSKAVDVAIINLEVGLKKHENLINKLRQTNVAEDMNFQRQYNGFFRMQRRTPEYYSCYFELLENVKSCDNIDFAYILKRIYGDTNRLEASFSSKMLSMINPNYPIWDKFVLQFFKIKAPYYSCKNRIEKIIDTYDELVCRYNDFMATDESREILNKFNNKYPTARISDIKKIDFVIWQIR